MTSAGQPIPYTLTPRAEAALDDQSPGVTGGPGTDPEAG